MEKGFVYEGKLKDGIPDGKVRVTWTKKGKVYEGEVKDGNRYGTVKMTYANGSVFEGEFVNGEPKKIRTKTKGRF